MLIKNGLIRAFLLAVMLAGGPLLLSNESLAQTLGVDSPPRPPSDSSAKPPFTGFVTGSGEVRVNDDRIGTTGSPLASGSTVATGPDADATVDLGQLGRLLIRPNTTVKVSFSGTSCEVLLQRCGSFTQFLPESVSTEVKLNLPKLAEVSSSRGEVQVGTGPDSKGRTSKQVVKAGKRKKVYGASSLKAKGDCAFTVNCCQCCMVDQYQK